MRYNRAFVERKIDTLNKIYGVDLCLDHSSQGYKIETKGGARSLSPRGSPNEMIVWLDAFEQGLIQMEHLQKRGTGNEEVNPPPMHG